MKLTGSLGNIPIGGLESGAGVTTGSMKPSLHVGHRNSGGCGIHVVLH